MKGKLRSWAIAQAGVLFEDMIKVHLTLRSRIKTSLATSLDFYYKKSFVAPLNVPFDPLIWTSLIGLYPISSRAFVWHF